MARAAAPAPLKTILTSSICFSDQFQRVEQGRAGDDGGAVLIVVKDRNAHLAAQPLLDVEAFRRFDVFQVDAAEAGLQQPDGLTEQLGVFGVQFQVDGVEVGEALEQERLALHDGLAGQRADIAQAEDGGAVGDDGDQVALAPYRERRLPGWR